MPPNMGFRPPRGDGTQRLPGPEERPQNALPVAPKAPSGSWEHWLPDGFGLRSESGSVTPIAGHCGPGMATTRALGPPGQWVPGLGLPSCVSLGKWLHLSELHISGSTSLGSPPQLPTSSYSSVKPLPRSLCSPRPPSCLWRTFLPAPCPSLACCSVCTHYVG